MKGAQAHRLADGNRLHLHHGPIDMVIEAFGPGREQAYEKAIRRFETLLDELVSELDILRQPCNPSRSIKGTTATRMQNACELFHPNFITPMAAVAGSVADEILAVMVQIDGLEKIYVNNGGDTAFYLRTGQTIRAAIAAQTSARIEICSNQAYRGIATSGWGGRSQSLGIADSVTIIAANAALADCAATLIANAVNLPDHPNVNRLPAQEIQPDSDLGERLVTTGVGDLSKHEIAAALAQGAALAEKFLAEGLIGGANLVLKNQSRQIELATFIQHKSQTLAGALDHA